MSQAPNFEVVPPPPKEKGSQVPVFDVHYKYRWRGAYYMAGAAATGGNGGSVAVGLAFFFDGWGLVQGGAVMAEAPGPNTWAISGVWSMTVSTYMVTVFVAEHHVSSRTLGASGFGKRAVRCASFASFAEVLEPRF
jgi:hypothetical protein